MAAIGGPLTTNIMVPQDNVTAGILCEAKFLQFLFPVVIFAITISAKQSYTKSHDHVKVVTYRVKFCTIDFMIRARILGILLGISSHKRGTVARTYTQTYH